jgi:hypothetical protein
MAEGLDIGTVDPRILALLGLMTSSSAGTNLNVLQDFAGDASFGLPLSTTLGTLPFEYLQSVVEGSEYQPLEAGFQAQETFDLYSGDEVLAPLLQAIDAGADPSQVIAEQKATVQENAELSQDQKKAANYRLDGYLSVLETFQKQLSADTELAEQVESGDVIQRDGRFFQRVPEATRRANLASQYGISGPLADLEMYGPSASTVERRDAATAAAEKFLEDQASERRGRLFELGDEYSRGVSAEEKRMERERAVQQARELAETQRRRDVLAEMGREPAGPDAFQTFPQARNVLDPTTVAAMAGMAQSRKPTQMSQQEFDRRSAQIAAENRAAETQAQERYQKMLAEASKIGEGEKTAAETYLENQQRLLSLLATPAPEAPKVTGTVRRPQVSLSSGQIGSIVGAITR